MNTIGGNYDIKTFFLHVPIQHKNKLVKIGKPALLLLLLLLLLLRLPLLLLLLPPLPLIIPPPLLPLLLPLLLLLPPPATVHECPYLRHDCLDVFLRLIEAVVEGHRVEAVAPVR